MLDEILVVKMISGDVKSDVKQEIKKAGTQIL